MLYRLFPFLSEADPRDEGGSLYVPRALQGTGRHDNPDRYGVLYTSRSEVSVVAEVLRALRRHSIGLQDLASEERPLAVAPLDDRGLSLADLDDPHELGIQGLRPSRVATRSRDVTQPQAVSLYEQGHDGFAWWSTIEASWINVTLFADRAVPRLSLAGEPEPLHVDHPAVREAADMVGVSLPSPRISRGAVP